MVSLCCKVALIALVALSACYNVSSVRIPLADNRAGADCQAACVARAGPHRAAMACMARCPGATTGNEACSAADLPPAGVCEHTSSLSRWKTYGLVGLGLGLLLLIL
jgi:hypothetical protein